MTDADAQALLRHARFVRSLARSLLPDEAEDVEQETWLAAVRGGPRHPGALRSWLAAVARNAARKLLRRRQAVTRRETAAARGDVVPPTSDAVAREQILQQVVKAVLDLDEPYRSTILLRFYEDLPPREVARRHGVSVETVRSRVRRALALLRGRLDSEWKGRRAWCLALLPLARAARAGTAAIAGGLLVKKNVVLVALLVALLLGGGVILRSEWESDRSHDRATSPHAERSVPTKPAERAPEAPPRTAGCFGRVLDPEGRPVAGATVRRVRLLKQAGPGQLNAVDAPETTTVTDGRGRFGVDVPDGLAAAEVVVDATGYPRARAAVRRSEEAIVRLARGGNVTVVARSPDGASLTEADVGLFDAAYPPPTHPLGSITFEHIPACAPTPVAPGRYLALVRAPGFAPKLSSPFEVRVGEAVEEAVALDRGIVMDVLVLGDGAPVAGAEVELRAGADSGGVARTDERGRCTISGLLPAGVLVSDSAVAYWEVRTEDFVLTRGRRTLAGQPGRDELTVRLGHGRRLTVTVRGADGPLEGARVTLLRSSDNPIRRELEVRTGPDGAACFPEMPVGEYEVTISHPGYAEQRRKMRVPSEIEVTLVRRDVTLRGTVRTPEGAPARGRVGYRPEGAPPMPPFLVCRAELDEAGRFRLEDLPPGDGALHVMADGFVHQEFPVRVRPDAPALDVRLAEGRTLHGNVVTEDGQPAPGLDLRFYRMLEVRKYTYSTSFLARTETDEQGAFAIRGSDEEPFHLMLPGYTWRADGADPRSIEPGRNVKIVVSRIHNLRFTVIARVAGQSAPYDGRLRCVCGQVGLAAPVKERPGRYVFTATVEPGLYDLRFEAPGHRPCLAPGVRLGKEDAEVTIELDPGAVLRVRVVDVEGNPVRDRALVVRGHGVMRTDSRGELVLGGDEPRTVDLHLRDADDEGLFARVRDVAVPGRVDAVLRRWATIYVHHERKWSEVECPVTWRAYDERGQLVDERTSQPYRMSNAAEIPCFAYLFAPNGGRYRIVARVDGEKLEGEVEAKVGSTARLQLR